MSTTIADFTPGMRVRYVPGHADGENDPECEDGTVSSVTKLYVFVKFDKQLRKFGWDGTTSQSCQAMDLVPLTKEHRQLA